jgi:hypothetical protein
LKKYISSMRTTLPYAVPGWGTRMLCLIGW